ncbi:hypothetical protein SKAU_G00338140 [Synaphobranchus kaupii]|uniref:Uncharacterized protein n=1 Tax=Synaphobranchus kaupii TaxID=118154 RepID=A0A9Q1EMI0_SYNKA|nr:hypothetical protein SKAU_G00338140 [Synaphobranchus kaupii]
MVKFLRQNRLPGQVATPLTLPCLFLVHTALPKQKTWYYGCYWLPLFCLPSRWHHIKGDAVSSLTVGCPAANWNQAPCQSAGDPCQDLPLSGRVPIDPPLLE